MQIYNVCLFGHRQINDLRRIDDRLEAIVRELIKTKEYVVFYIGRNGEFDEYAASVIKRVQREYGKENSELTLVLPYKVADIDYYEKYYDSVTIPDVVCGSHPKSAISRRNRWMIESSSLVIVYAKNDTGGVFDAVRYAKRLDKDITNIAE